MKRVRIRSFSGPYFPELGLNTERYSVFLRAQSECGKYGPELLRIGILFMQWELKLLIPIRFHILGSFKRKVKLNYRIRYCFTRESLFSSFHVLFENRTSYELSKSLNRTDLL